MCASIQPVYCVSQSVVARGLLNSIQEKSGYVPVYINFSAQTSSARTQEIIESKLEKKRKKVLGNDSHKISNLKFHHVSPSDQKLNMSVCF